MCIIEFVDFNEAYTLGKLPSAAAEEAKPKTRRSRKKATDAVEDATVVAEKKAPKAKPVQKAVKNTGAKVSNVKTNVGKKM
jgi:large subunit ribosomal protein L17